MHRFDRATAVTPAATAGSFHAHVDPGFTVGPKPNGGYLLALAARAIADALGTAGSEHRDALATTAHFVGAPNPGPVEITTEILRTGRSASQARATIDQDGTRCVDVTATMGTLPSPQSTPAWSAISPFSVADRDDCFRLPPNPPGGEFTVSIMNEADLRMDPATLGWAAGKGEGWGELRGWISFDDGRPVDSLGMLFFLDAPPPATFDVVRSGWVPTLSLTTYLRAAPSTGALRIRQKAQLIDDGRVDEVCELWDSADRLVGQATQLAAIRTGDAPVIPFPG